MRTVGVEEEFLLVRPSSAALAPVGDAAVATAVRTAPGQYEHELKRQQVELGTRPHTSMRELADDLRALRVGLAAAAEHEGARLAALATSPLDPVALPTPEERYERMTELYGAIGRSLLTCGMHVHVSITSPDEGVRVLDRIRPWLPVLRALSTNSPYAAGQDTGYASFRTVLWGQWPTAGSAEPYGDVAGYEAAKAGLVRSGAALDDGMIYFDARLSARYPTVEIRVADVCPYAADAVVLAAFARGLVEAAARDELAVPDVRTDLLRAAHWRSARWGMDGDLLDVVTGEPRPAWAVVADLRAQLHLDDDDALVDAGLAEIARRGTGARLQREAFAGRRSWGDVVDAVVRRTVGQGAGTTS